MTTTTGMRAVRRRAQGGFTLIELLVVIVILGILSAIVVFAVRGADDKGNDAALQTDERTIRTALEVFCARNNRYPGPVDPMGELVAGKYLSNPSEYHKLSTGDGDAVPEFGPEELEPEGRCTGTPRNFKLEIDKGLPGPEDPPPPPISAVSAGFRHSLRLTSGGEVFASGSNGSGELGDGTTTDRQRPVQVTGLEDVKAVETGSFFSVALKNDGTVWAWGRNSSRQLGDGTGFNRTLPVRSGGDSFGGVTAISAAAGGHVLALRNGAVNGEVWAWGGNRYGQVGNRTEGSTLDSEAAPLPVKGANNSGSLNGVTAIAAGTVHSLAVKDGAVWAWGRNIDGQLGDGTNIDRLTPVPVQGLGGGVTAIAAGEIHSVALKEDGTVWAWGRNSDGQLGDGTNIDRLTPVQVKGENGLGILQGVTAIASGRHHVLASKNGAVWAWGINQGLGNDSLTPSTTPVRVKGYRGVGELTGATALAGSTFSMAVMGDGRVLMWGPNSGGQFGTGDWEGSLVPTDENDPRPPDNDLIKDRMVLPGTGSSVPVSYTNMFAGQPETDEPSHQPESYGPSAGKSVWFQWTNGSISTGTVTFFTAEGAPKSNFNTTIAAYTIVDPLNPTPSVSNLTPVEDLDRNDSPGEESRVTVPATVGVVYFIAIDGRIPGAVGEGGIKLDEGGIQLSWTIRTPDQRRPCGGYDC